MLGRYIDALPEKAKARVVRWQTWCSGSLIDENPKYRDLLGVAENWYGIRAHDWSAVEARVVVARMVGEWCPPQHACVIDRIGGRWDRLVKRVGLQKAVYLVKMRAAKENNDLVGRILQQVDSRHDSAITY